MKTKLQVLTILTSSVLLNLFLILPSCGDPEIEYYIDEETKSYCYFENGASYIYKDSVTGIIDSIKLTSDWYRPFYVEDICEAYATDITNWNGEVIGECKIEVVNLSDFPSCACFNFSNSNIIKHSIYNSCNMEVGENQYIGVIGDLYETYSSFPIENIEYYDVKKFKFTYTDDEFNSGYAFSYWAKSVGLIRYEAYDINDSLLKNINLIEYEINN